MYILLSYLPVFRTVYQTLQTAYIWTEPILAYLYATLRSKQRTLHGPSMFAVKAKIYRVFYYQYSFIAFDETSNYWSAPKKKILDFSLVTTRLSGFHWSAFGNHEDNTFTEKDCKLVLLSNRIRPCGPCIAAIAGL